MNSKTLHRSLAVFASAALFSTLAGCATARPAGSPPDTDVSVLDEGGSSVPGEYELWSPRNKDSCSTSGSSCSVSLPEGDYNLTFKKLRGGRLAQSGGGNVSGERDAGCLRSRVHLVPGQEISCKKVAEYNCSTQAVETMDCGAASAARYGARAPAATPGPR